MATYDANGHEVTVKQRNGSISAWIDEWAVDVSGVLEDFPDNDITEELREKLDYYLDNGNNLEALKVALSWMTSCNVYYCSKCNSFYDHNNVVGTGFAGHKCKDCDDEAKYCPDNPDGDRHVDRCLNPSDKHNARVSTKYKCKHCGRKRSTTPTG